MNPNNPYQPDEGTDAGSQSPREPQSSHDDPLASNAYSAQYHEAAAPDLDAGAPQLRSNDLRRMNQRALLLLGAVVVLLLFVAYWMISGAGSKGHTLKADGNFGPETKHAVEKFQTDHSLREDGKAGLHTQTALHAALHAKLPPALNDKRNPDHALYQQALAGVHKIDADMGRTSDNYSCNLAAALATAAKTQGLTRIDIVALSDDGSRAFAAQDTLPFRTFAHVFTAHAVNTTIEQSSAAAQAVQPKPIPEQTPPLANVSMSLPPVASALSR